MSGFLSSLFGGQNTTLNANIGSLGATAGATNKAGMGDVNDASSFWHSILSGGGKQALAPQIGAIQKQGAQQKMSLSQFGNRSGGTNAAAQTIDDKGAASINDLIASLTGQAASNIGSLGQGLLGTSLQATGMQDDASQQRMKNWQSSILGQGISSGVGFAEGFGLGKI